MRDDIWTVAAGMDATHVPVGSLDPADARAAGLKLAQTALDDRPGRAGVELREVLLALGLKTVPETTSRCGTLDGYRAHRDAGHRACRACRSAQASAAMDRARVARDAAKAKARAELSGGLDAKRAAVRRVPCGTRGGYDRHLRLDERPCTECRAAKAQASRERRAALAAYRLRADVEADAL